jgi:hypothetical protein
MKGDGAGGGATVARVFRGVDYTLTGPGVHGLDII